MIYSMTGFGSARAEAENLNVLVELKSVNHRHIDIHVKIPGEFQSFENQVKQRISAAFNLLGQQVTTLIEGNAHPGEYSVTFDGAKYPSGFYVYRLTSGNFSDMRKMFLIK